MIEINWNAFTPWASLTGGLLIGLSAIVLITVAGRIAGISGIIGGLLKPYKGDIGWRLAFLIGMITAPWIYQALFGPFEFESHASTVTLVISGLLVGYGTRLGSGCTSGHGVCGLSRLSLRSLAATLVFMAVGFVIATTTHLFL